MSKEREAFALDPSDRTSLVWNKLRMYYEKRLESLRTGLEKKVAEDDANMLRGQIKEVRALLKLGADE